MARLGGPSSSHDYRGNHTSRHVRKQSKLGPGIISVRRLEQILKREEEKRKQRNK